ncbi:hypothetical protein [Pyxidicoccus xibeiensis]|uniref:hypothetical protein n=1 Tax=Pyxidicoccus xibeiensis TaxID=2906759 RepID=UPI0020A7211D|nr:hypothetical protein [Pyxidicoccus xibeiensis]MCP3137299.1 hypothetical protein [Pyxidicoccus xibeiensis]
MKASLMTVLSVTAGLMAGTARAQGACPSPEVTAGEDMITAPAGFPTLVKAQVRTADAALVDARLGEAGQYLKTGNVWAPSLIGALRTEAARLKGTPGFLFQGTGDATCFQAVKLASDGGSGGGKTGEEGDEAHPPRSGTLAECKQDASDWEQEISRQAKGSRKPGYTLIVFMESGEICHANRLYGIEGDPIYVGVYTAIKQWAPTRFEPCAIEPATPAVYISVDKVSLTRSEQSLRQSDVWELRKNTPRRCFNANVDISFRRSQAAGDEGAIRFNLSQHELYRATLQLGAIFTPQHVRDFDVRPSGEENILYSKGPNGRGVEYTASLVLYGAPRYVISLFGGPSYSGRDLVHDQGVLDRLGAVLGIGLTQPGRRFVAGLSFEVIYGVNVLYVADVLRAPQPVGARLDEPFAGTRDDIRTEERWSTRGVFGLSVDLLYVKELFSGRITP